MGAGFLGVEEAARHLGAEGMKGELPGLQNIPFDEAILSSLSRSHLLFPGSPLSILDLRRVAGGPFPIPEKRIGTMRCPSPWRRSSPAGT